MRELIVAGQRELDCDSKTLDRHDRYRSHRRAYADVHHGILLAVHRSNLVNHYQRKASHNDTVCQEAYPRSVSLSPESCLVLLQIALPLPLLRPV